MDFELKKWNVVGKWFNMVTINGLDDTFMTVDDIDENNEEGEPSSVDCGNLLAITNRCERINLLF